MKNSVTPAGDYRVFRLILVFRGSRVIATAYSAQLSSTRNFLCRQIYLEMIKIIGPIINRVCLCFVSKGDTVYSYTLISFCATRVPFLGGYQAVFRNRISYITQNKSRKKSDCNIFFV